MTANEWFPIAYLATIVVVPALVLAVMGWRWHRDVCKGHDRCPPPHIPKRERIVCARCLGRGSVAGLVGGSLSHLPCPECHGNG